MMMSLRVFTAVLLGMLAGCPSLAATMPDHKPAQSIESLDEAPLVGHDCGERDVHAPTGNRTAIRTATIRLVHALDE